MDEVGEVGVEAGSQRALPDESTVSLRLLSMLWVLGTAGSNSRPLSHSWRMLWRLQPPLREVGVVEDVEGVEDSEGSEGSEGDHVARLSSKRSHRSSWLQIRSSSK